MNKKAAGSFLFPLALTLFLHAPFQAQANDDLRQQRYAEWQKLEQSKDKRIFFDSILNPTSQQDFIYGLDFLKERIVKKHVSDPTYFTSYAQMLWAAKVKETAGAMAAAAVLILKTDAARCADKTSGQTRLLNTLNVLKEPLLFYRSATEEERETMFHIAFNIENSLQNRPANSSICYSGIKAMAQSIELMKRGKIQGETIIDKEKPSAETVLVPESSDVKIELISDSAWLEKREEIRRSFKSYILGSQEKKAP